MRSLFRGFYPPSDIELSEMWDHGSIILDTNALLNLYRYSESTREDFLSVLGGLKDRLWIPAQVGLEFQTRRLGVIDEQRNAFKSIKNHLESTQKTLEGEIGKFNRHSSLDIPQLKEVYVSAVEGILRDLTAQEKAHTESFGRGFPQDSIWENVTALLDGKVGPAFTAQELSEIYVDGASRYESEIPPGYKDTEKGTPSMYGDLVIWKEILQRSEQKGDAAIFVTDDGKEDWWRIEKGETLGPRPELIDEYFAATGKRIHFYSSLQFLKYSKDRRKATVSDASLSEVERVSAQADAHVQNLIRARLVELRRDRKRLERLTANKRHAHVVPDFEGIGFLRKELARTARRLEGVEEEQMMLRSISSRSDKTEEDRLSTMYERQRLDELEWTLREEMQRLSDELHTLERPDDRNVELRESMARLDAEIREANEMLSNWDQRDRDDERRGRSTLLE